MVLLEFVRTCILTQLVRRRLDEAVHKLQGSEHAVDIVLLAQRRRHVAQLHRLPILLQALPCQSASQAPYGIARAAMTTQTYVLVKCCDAKSEILNMS